jgi:hypothetical protein
MERPDEPKNSRITHHFLWWKKALSQSGSDGVAVQLRIVSCVVVTRRHAAPAIVFGGNLRRLRRWACLPGVKTTTPAAAVQPGGVENLLTT